MTEESKVEVELHDEKINDIVEETLEEKTEPKGGSTDVKAPSEEDSVASVDKAAKATSKTNLPKTKAGMINAMYKSMSKMKKADLQAAYGKVMEEMENDDLVIESNTTSEIEALVESEATLSEEFKQKTAVIFEAAVKSKLSDEVSRLEEQY